MISRPYAAETKEYLEHVAKTASGTNQLNAIAELEYREAQSASLRAEAREEENLSISRRALVISEEARDSARFANRIAITAMIFSIITAIIAYFAK